MDRVIIVDIFVEDRAHEDFVHAMVLRISRENSKRVDVRVRSARGGHGRALSELDLYQSSVAKGIAGLATPDLLIVAIDANCNRFQAAQKNIKDTLHPAFQNIVAIACPDPHIERWYLADKAGFAKAVGISPKLKRHKCERDYYKAILAKAVVDAGHVPTLGGIEFAREIVNAMDLYHAAKEEKSLKAFLDSLKAHLKR